MVRLYIVGTGERDKNVEVHPASKVAKDAVVKDSDERQLIDTKSELSSSQVSIG